MKIALLTDSSAGIKNTKDYKDFFLIPLMISLENGEQIEDNIDLDDDKFYSLNDSQILKTSQSIPGQVMKKWDELLKEYDQVICLLLSKGLSGQYSTCKMLSEEDEYKGKVFVADTNGVSIVLKAQIQKALKMIQENKTAQEIVNQIENSNNKFEVYIVPKSLDQLVRGGRISKAAAGLAKVLKITPILKYDGTIDKQGKTRTFKKAIEETIDLLIANNPNIKTIDMSYSKTDLEIINQVKKIIKDKGLTIVLEETMPYSVTCHTGRETFAIGMWKE